MLQFMNPKSLSEAVQMAFKQEHTLTEMGRNTKYSGKSGWNSTSKAFSQEFPYTLVDSKSKDKKDMGGSSKVPPARRLTPAEMDVRRKQNLCFNCDEVYHIGHKCKKVFVILVEDQVDDDNELVFEEPKEDDQNLRVSLNALNGLFTPDTVKLAGSKGKQTITILWEHP